MLHISRTLIRLSISYLLLVLPLSSALLAQSFDISNYARPDLVRTTLTFNPSGSFNYTQDRSASSSSLEQFGSIGLPVFTTIFINKQRLQRTGFASFRGHYSSGKGDDGIKDWSTWLSLQADLTDRVYGPTNGFFLAYGGRLNYNYRWNNEQNLNYLNTLSTSAKIGAGYGRLEVVNDAWNAVTFTHIVGKQMGLDLNADSLQLHRLADQIAELKNNRYFDPRLADIDQIATIATYLLAEFPELESTPYLHAVIADTWLFEDFYFRQSGFRVEQLVAPRLSGFNTTRDTELDWNPWLDLTLSVEYHKPLSIKWQLETSLQCRYNARIGNHSGNLNNNQDIYDVEASLSLGWLPSRRDTWFNTLSIENFNNRYFGNGTQYNFRSEYTRYISPRFTYNIAITAGRNTESIDWNNGGYEITYRYTVRPSFGVNYGIL